MGRGKNWLSPAVELAEDVRGGDGAPVEGSEVWATPAIHNGKLYAKGERELVCVNLKAD